MDLETVPNNVMADFDYLALGGEVVMDGGDNGSDSTAASDAARPNA